MQYVEDIKNLRSLLLNEIGKADEAAASTAAGPNGSNPNNRETILKKALKCKQLEDDNKKLRKLLKTQIENSEQLRQDTQSTIEAVREEFDILVKELLQYKSKDETKKGGPTGAANASGSGVPKLTGLPVKGGENPPAAAAGGGKAIGGLNLSLPLNNLANPQIGSTSANNQGGKS